MGFSRQEYWSGLPFPSPGDLPNPGTEPMSPALQADSLPLSHRGSPLWSSTALNSRLLPLPFFILLTASICHLLVKIQGFKTDFGIKESTARLEHAGGFSGGPVFKNPACGAGGMVWPLVWEDFTCRRAASSWGPTPKPEHPCAQLKIPHEATRILRAATEAQRTQINILKRTSADTMWSWEESAREKYLREKNSWDSSNVIKIYTPKKLKGKKKIGAGTVKKWVLLDYCLGVFSTTTPLHWLSPFKCMAVVPMLVTISLQPFL